MYNSCMHSLTTWKQIADVETNCRPTGGARTNARSHPKFLTTWKQIAELPKKWFLGGSREPLAVSETAEEQGNRRGTGVAVRLPLFLGGFPVPRRFPKPPTVRANRRGTTFWGARLFVSTSSRILGANEHSYEPPPSAGNLFPRRQFVSTSSMNACMSYTCIRHPVHIASSRIRLVSVGGPAQQHPSHKPQPQVVADHAA